MKQTLHIDKGENTPLPLTPGLWYPSVHATSSCSTVAWSCRLFFYRLHWPEQIVLQSDWDKMVWILNHMDIATICPIFLEHLSFFHLVGRKIAFCHLLSFSGWLKPAQAIGSAQACECPGWWLGTHRWTLKVQWTSSARIHWYACICIADLI